MANVDRESVLKAIKEFDANLRSTGEWSNWDRRYDYAIEIDDRLYQAKQILSMATGRSKEDFSGGEQTNRPLLQLGFKIVDIRDLDSKADLQQSLEKILGLYGEVRRTMPFGVHEELWGIFEKVRTLFKGSTPVRKRPTIEVTWGVGKGAWAQVPWIAFLDSRSTDSTTTGVYAVLLFREDMSGIYAALNQGITKPTDEYGQAAGMGWLRQNALRLRQYCAHLSVLGFALDDQIDLRAGSA